MLLAIPLVLPSPTASRAQDATIPPQFGIVIDGSKNPERIQDSVAILMYMSLIATPTDADARTLRFLSAKLSPLDLDSADMEILRPELARLHTRLQRNQEELTTAYEEAGRLRTAEVIAAATAAADRRQEIAEDGYARLLQILSPAAARSLQAHIQAVKRQIKSIGPVAR